MYADRKLLPKVTQSDSSSEHSFSETSVNETFESATSKEHLQQEIIHSLYCFSYTVDASPTI